jgi:ubiquinol-cytochrome c reductase cytochrome b subunit
MYIGSQHVEEPFVTVGMISTSLYFGWFLIIVPVIGLVENTLLDLACESK